MGEIEALTLAYSPDLLVIAAVSQKLQVNPSSEQELGCRIEDSLDEELLAHPDPTFPLHVVDYLDWSVKDEECRSKRMLTDVLQRKVGLSAEVASI